LSSARQDDMALIDERLKLLGIQNLDVIDTSIMPRIMSGNTNPSTIMIAEKAVNMIIEYSAH
jgi:choline dehydrogenase-like flavoprotein